MLISILPLLRKTPWEITNLDPHETEHLQIRRTWNSYFQQHLLIFCHLRWIISFKKPNEWTTLDWELNNYETCGYFHKANTDNRNWKEMESKVRYEAKSCPHSQEYSKHKKNPLWKSGLRHSNISWEYLGRDGRRKQQHKFPIPWYI